MWSRIVTRGILGMKSAIPKTMRAGIKRFSAEAEHTSKCVEEEAAPHFHINKTHKILADVMGTVMWFWIFYRCKKDGAVVFVFLFLYYQYRD